MQKILVVEDDASYLKLLTDQFSKTGYEVFEARDGQEGLAIAKVKHPDLIVLDIRMPIMNGLTMLDELRQDEYGKKVKVIILSNLEADDSILQKVTKDQPTYYLVKSEVRLSELLDKVKEILQ